MIKFRFVLTVLLLLASLSSGAAPHASAVEDKDENITGSGAPRVADGVLTGIDVLIQQKFVPLRGKRVGLVTNQTGLTRDGAFDHRCFGAGSRCKAGGAFWP
jgi:uncharacterized protein YbbC (DUF1343 family)